MGEKTVKSRVKVYAVGVLTLVTGIGVAGFARGGAEASDTPPQAVSLGAENVYVVATGSVQSGPVISGSIQPERKAAVRRNCGRGAEQEDSARITRDRTARP